MMQRRQRLTSISTETLRSLVSIAEAGSITKAAKMLGISQPAISAQIKRIEDLVGGAIFAKSANGSTVTDLGDLVLIQARKIIEANQQILLLGGMRSDHRGFKVGIGDLQAHAAFKALAASELDDVSLVVNSGLDIMSGLLNGYIDLGLFMLLPSMAIDPSIEVLAERSVEMAWVRAHDFALSPGAPVPLLTWGGQIAHHLMIDGLERQGLIYRIAFSSPNLQFRIDAAERGLGLTVMPRSEIPTTLVEARDYYLPELPAAKLYLCRRLGSGADHHPIHETLRENLFPEPAAGLDHKRVG